MGAERASVISCRVGIKEEQPRRNAEKSSISASRKELESKDEDQEASSVETLIPIGLVIALILAIIGYRRYSTKWLKSEWTATVDEVRLVAEQDLMGFEKLVISVTGDDGKRRLIRYVDRELPLWLKGIRPGDRIQKLAGRKDPFICNGSDEI